MTGFTLALFVLPALILALAVGLATLEGRRRRPGGP